jgi:hypothetical protein
VAFAVRFPLAGLCWKFDMMMCWNCEHDDDDDDDDDDAVDATLGCYLRRGVCIGWGAPSIAS